jgi:thioredoxin reductase (NADPH)
MAENVENLVIIGSGPAGYTAAVYAGRARLEPTVLAGRESGGQLMLTTEVENYPGFPDGVMGPELMELFRKQAERFGSKIIDVNATKVDFSKRPFTITHENGSLKAKAVIVATGASAMWLGLESETRLRGHGVSSCATCDGAFFRDKVVAVVGGGDSAMEESNFLTRFATKVYVLHRRDEFRASKIMQERTLANPKIEVVWNTVVDEVLGKDKVEGIKVSNTQTGEKSTMKVDGLFLAIGHKPNTKIFEGQLKLDKKGYIVIGDASSTSVEGVFAAGDVHDLRYRQAITAAGSGCKAAMDAEKWLEAQEHSGASKPMTPDAKAA